MSDNQYLNPWYRLETDPEYQEVFNRPESAIYVHTSQPAVKSDTTSEEKTTYRSVRLVIMELVVRGRRDLQGLEPFEWPDDFYKGMCTSWFNEQKAKGLKMMTFFCGEITKEAAYEMIDCCIFCWYSDGLVACFVPGVTTKDGNSDYPALIATEKANRNVKGMIFNDNAEAFSRALQAIAECAAPFEWWQKRFNEGLKIMRTEHVKYTGQPETFPMPEPYFKYLLAVQSTNLGYGMGSWSDLPIAGSDTFKAATANYLKESDNALMYAVNNC